ncbi:hypothetical protein CVD28_03455 [Bacillus sp. M6-12]|uniref:hypothetical protein n=1 Tax=Bacillus sp. M6-12 TaxID=2054166 RepID=UPI000C79041F|nr:hypothetical protein [Bacillus sp. M6-12]PLS19486.1 hypothetical protein CVD28_03455 [Bacillus sp. M6-12]
MLKKYVFTMKRNNQIISEDTFEIIRSKKNRNKIHVIEKTTSMSGGRKEMIYQTDKSDKEIIDHFNQKYSEYDKKMKETKSFFKQNALPKKFDYEFDLYFGKPIGEDIHFAGKKRNNARDSEEQLSDNHYTPIPKRSPFSKSLSSSIGFTMMLYILHFFNVEFVEKVYEPLLYGFVYFVGMFIGRLIGSWIFGIKQDKKTS